MEFNRNQFFMIGLVLLLLGTQFRLVDTVLLTPDFTQFLAKRTDHPVAAVNASPLVPEDAAAPNVKKTIRPPDWLGWCLLSVGSVLVLHSMAMRKPD